MTRPAGPWSRSRSTPGGAAMSERRVDDLEKRVDDLDRKLDNRFMWLLAAFAAGCLALGGLILNRTDAINDKLGAKIDAVSQRLSDLSERTARIEARLPPQR